MKLELTYDEVSTICHALLLKAVEAATGARECAKLGDMDNDVKFWQERAENYKKVYEAVVARREQAFKAYEQAAVGAGAGAEEEEVREMEEAVDKRLLKILEQLDAEDNRMIPNDKKEKIYTKDC